MNSLDRTAPAVYTCVIEQSHIASSPSSKAQAGGISKQIQDPKFLLTLYLFQDILGILDRTCKLWQTANIDLSAITLTIKQNLDQFKALKERKASHWVKRAEKRAAEITAAVRSYADKVKAKEETRRNKEKVELAELKAKQALLEAEADERGEDFSPQVQRPQRLKGNLMNELRSFSMEFDAKLVKDWDKNVRQALLSAIIDNMVARVPQDKIVSALDTLFNPEGYPDSYSLEYGKQALETLIGHYGVTRQGQKPVMDADSVREEWPSFFSHALEAKGALDKQRGKERKEEKVLPTKMARVLKAVLRKDFITNSCPNVIFLAQLALIFCITTVPCESGFSYMKLTKTALRSLLGDDKLETELLVQIEGPDPDDFPYDLAVRIWYARKERRLKIHNLSNCKSSQERGAQLTS